MLTTETCAQPDWTDAIREELKAYAFNGRVGSMLASETDRVRVWHLSLPPGERIGFHRHVNDYFWTALTEGRAKSRYSSGEVKLMQYCPGDTRHFKFAKGEYMLHDLENVGNSVLSFVTVEFLGGGQIDRCQFEFGGRANARPTDRGCISLASRPRQSASQLASSPPARKAGGEAPLQTLARGLRILKYIAKQDQLVRLRDVAQAFDLERSIALRLLQSLEAEGFVRKHEGLKAYSLGPALTELARPKPFIERLAERIRPLLGSLTQVTGQTSHLAVLEGRSAVLVEVRQATGPIIVQQAAGDAEALYCSAIGKAIYAFLPESEQRELVSQMKFERHTSSTLLSAKQLNEEAVAIRKVGVAFDRSEGPLPLKCIAAPILNEEGRPVASVGISCVSAMIPQPIESMRSWIKAVKHCAGSIERELVS